MGRCERMLWALLGFVALPLSAQETTLEAVAARYLAAETYCDAGKRSQRWEPQQAMQGEPFTRCAHRDGRFKHVESAGSPHEVVNWSDGEKHHRYFRHNRLYQEHSFDDAMHFDLYRNRAELIPVFLLRPFSSEPRNLTEKQNRTSYLRSFKPSALSTPEYSVFERMNLTYPGNGERIWVRKSDQVIVKHEAIERDTVMRVVEISRAEFNRPLAPADLSFDAPVSARFSLQSNPVAFVILLFIVAAIAGAGLWGWLFAQAPDPADVVHKRGRLWRFQLWALLAVAALLAILAVATSIGPDKGHPPAIVIVFVLAFWAAVAFGLAACFTALSYPAQWLFARRR